MSRRLALHTLALVAILILTVPALGAAVQERPYQSYVNEQFGFRLTVPGGWVGQGQKTNSGGKALIFSGPKGSEEYFTTINVQVVKVRHGATVQQQARKFAQQLATAPKHKITSVTEGKLAGAPAVRILCIYQHPGNKEIFQQDQVIALRGGFFYWLGFTAPKNLYSKYHPIMDRCLGSFDFSKP